MSGQEFIADAVRLTFEEMAFLDVAPGRAGDEADPGPGPWLFLTYTQPQTGSLGLFLPKEVKFAVAEGIYGDSWNSLLPGQLDDSLLELMNVLAGRLLTGRFGTGSASVMGLPTLLYDPRETPPGMQCSRFEFHIDEKELTLLWYEVQS